MDVRLLTFVAETGRAAVHDIAGHLGMDVREVAARLAALSTGGLPLVVGVECDPGGVRNALAAAGAWGNHPSGGYAVGPPSSPQSFGPHSGGYAVHGGPSGPHPPRSGPGSGPRPVAPQTSFPPFGPVGPPPDTSAPQPGPAASTVSQPAVPQRSMNPWGPPGSASWARGDQQTDAGGSLRHQPSPPPRSGRIGTTLEVDGPEGERIDLLLVEVVDPADFLITAAGYELREGERSVVVHTELTNRGATPFTALPDLSLVLVAEDGSTVAKAPVSLSSRPPHRTGVPPGETAGGHTVYVLPESTRLSGVRWTPRPGDERRTLTWDITGL